MEVKAWSYEDMPAFDEQVEGAVWVDTTGDEPGVSYSHDVEYCEVNGTKLHLQILQPVTRNTKKFIMEPGHEADTDRPKYPCIVYVQGSGWHKQNVYGNLPMVAGFARRGYVVAIVEYRHCGIAHFPAPVVDARNAVRYMRANAVRWMVDPERVILMGNSSGGHTAVYAGIYHNDGAEGEDLFPGVSAEVKGIINQYGSTDFTFDDSNPTTTSHNGPDSPEGLEMGGIDLNKDTAARDRLSVRMNIFPDTDIVPVMHIHGTKDRIVNCRCSVYLHQRMKECGKDSTLYLIKGGDHGGPEFMSEHMLDVMEAFIKRCLEA